MDNRKLEIARKLAIKEFAVSREDDVSLDDLSIDSAAVVPSHRASDIICDPRNTSLYSHHIERSYVTQLNLNAISAELEKAMRHSSITLLTLVKTMRRMLKASLFGCEVNIGLSPTVGTQVLEFIDESNNKRRVRRGQSACFECIDQGDVVLQVSSVPSKKKPDAAALGDGETAIYVPLIGRTGALGVVEIHGLQSPSVTNTAHFQRDTELLKALIAARDYSFVEHTKLWRLPKDRCGGVVSVHDKKDYTYAAHQVVAGVITEVVTEQNGVPFFGGARYNILWEDGLVEKTVVGSELLNTYQQTPQSLGVTSTVSEELLQALMHHVTEAAFVLERQRTAETLRRTQDSVNFPNLRDIDIMDRSLGAIITVVQNLREVFVLGVDCPSVSPDGSRIEVPESSIHILQKKSPQLKLQIKGMQQTPRSIVKMFCSGLESSKSEADLVVYEHMTIVQDQKGSSNKAQWVVKELLFPSYFKWNANPACRRFFIAVIKVKNSEREATRGDLKCVEDLSNILTSSLTVSCKKDLRKKRRRVIMQGVERDLHEWRSLPTTTLIAQSVIAVAAMVTPGVNSYVALLAPGGKRLDYIACSEGSGMTGNVLHAKEGVSFTVIDHQETLLVEKGFVDKSKLIAVGDNVNVRYGKVEFKAKILKNRGHGFYDVQYTAAPGQKEVAVPLDRISPLVASFKMKKFGDFSFPLLVIPVRHRTKSLGVLGMDSFDQVERAPYDPQPEPGLKLFLEHLGKVLGSCVDLQRKKRSIREASSVSRNVHSTNEDLFKALFEVVFVNFLFAVNVAIVNVRKDKNKQDKKQVEVLSHSGTKLSKDSLDTLATYDSTRSSQKPVQFKGNSTVWLLCRVKIPEVNAAKTFNKKKKKKSFTRKDYIFLINSAKEFDDVDSEFLYALQKFATMILQNIESRKHKADIRGESLGAIKDTCESWESFVHNRDAFFSEICEAIGACYLSANVYVGKLLQSANSIEYVLASQFSEMQGKVLHRHPSSGLSFRAVDAFSHVAVTKSDLALCDRLHHFGAREALEYPFVAVPLATFLDSPLGILAADALDDITQDEDGSPNEVVSFLYAVASHLSTPMKHFWMEDVATRLADITAQSENFEDAFKVFKGIVLSLLPYSKDIAYIAFNPMLADNFAYKPPIRIGMVYIIQMVEAKCLIDFVTNPFIKVQWKHTILLNTECHRINTSEENDPSLCVIKIPEGTRYEDIKLMFYLYGTANSKKRELSKRTIGLQQMSNDGAHLIEHNMECQYAPLPNVHAGRLKFVGRLYSETDILRIVFRQVTCCGLINIATSDSEQNIDPHCVLRWKGIEVGRTEVARGTSNPSWENLELFIKPSDEDIRSQEPTLRMEIWETDALDRGSCLGLHCFSMAKLINNNSSKPVVLTNEANQDTCVGSMKLVTDVVYASNMDRDMALDALKIPFLSETIIDSGEDLEEIEDFADLTLKNRKCELTIQSARLTRSELAEMGADESAGGCKPYCVVFFNGAEIGRTGSASQDQSGDGGDFCNTFLWDAEVLIFEISAEVNLDNCRIHVELWIFDEAEKGTKVGTLSVEEKCFASLLCTGLHVSKWYDVQSLSQDSHSCGELLLRGKPLDTILESTVVTRPMCSPTLLVDLEEICLKYSSVEEEAKTHILKVKMNDVLLISQNLSSVQSGESCPLSCSAHFMRPNDVSLFDSVMKLEIYQVSKKKPVVLAVLNKQRLVDFLDNSLQRALWVDLTYDRAVCEGPPATTARVRLLGGPVDTDTMLESDGRFFGLDVLGSTGLVPPPYHGLRRPNSYCKVFWNEEEVGRTSIAWNATDPLWSTHRFTLPIHRVDGLSEEQVLSFCSVKIEMWAVATLLDRQEELLGCVMISGDSLNAAIGLDHAQLMWHPLEMSSSYPLKQQEFVCSQKGAVKLRLFRGGCMTDEAEEEGEQRGGEFLLKIHEARALAEIDHFTKTNAKAIIYWNNVEVGRTAVIPSETNPVWEEEVFLLRAAPGASLADQRLQLHLYDSTGGITGDFLGCVDVVADQLVDFFGRKLTEVQAYTLVESEEMDDSDNRHVAGSLFLSAEIVSIKPVAESVELYSKASLYVRGAIELLSTNVFLKSSDTTCVVYWSSVFDQKSDVEIGRTKIAWKTVNPSWQKEKIIVNVPVVDEWSSVSVRLELRDIAAYGDSTFLGSVVLTGADLKGLLSRTGSSCSDLVQYKLSLSSPLVLPEFSSYTVEGMSGATTCNSWLVLAGGAGSKLIIDSEKENSGGGSGENVGSQTIESGGDSGPGGGLFKGLKNSMSVLSIKDRLKKRESKSVEFRILEIGSLCLPESLSEKEVPGVSKLLYFKATFNEEEIRIGSDSGTEAFSNNSLRVKFSSGPLVATFRRPQEEDLAACSTQLELWLSSSPDPEAEEKMQLPVDLFLGSVQLQGRDIVSLMRPKAPSRSFSLKNKKGINDSQNRYVVGSSIVVSGFLPTLMRQLSKGSIESSGNPHSSVRAAAVEEVDELLREEKIEIHICEASGLHKSTSLLGSLQEYRADVFWNDKLSCSTQHVKATASAASSSLVDVIWGNEYVTLIKQQGQALVECKLTVNIMSSSTFWGEVSFEGEGLLDFLEGKEPDWCTLTSAASTQKSIQKNIQGKLFCAARVVPINSSEGGDEASNDLHEYDTSKPLPEGMRDLQFSVLAAHDLGKADKFGKSDPYCVVRWNGVEIGKTDVKKKTLDPVWEKGQFLLRTYVNLGPVEDVVNKSLIKSYTAHDSLKLGADTAVVSQVGRRRQVVAVAAVTPVTYQARTDSVLVVEVWDWNAMGNSVFLGCFELKGPALASFFECKHIKRNWYKLGKSKKLSRSANKLVRGSIEISVGPAAPPPAQTGEPCSLEVEVAAVRNLCKVDEYSQADPYCIVRWNQDICGMTSVMKNTLNPEWENETFEVNLYDRKGIEEGFLYIEVWDFDVGIQGKFLGSVLIKGNKLRRLLEKGDMKWFDLSKSEFLTPALQNLVIGGSIRVKVSHADPNKRKKSNTQTTSFELTAVGAEKLSNSAFFGNVDSFCILKLNGREIGMSATITESSNPNWNEKFPLVMNTYTNDNGEECSDDKVSLEVWSVLALARGEFLGAVDLTLAELLQLTANCKSLKAADRLKTYFSLKTISVKPESAQTHIRGSLRLHARHFGAVNLQELGATAAAEVKMQWPVHSPHVEGTTLGFPSFELSILSITDLMVPAKGRSSTVVPDPFCLIFFNGQEVGTTPVCSNTRNPVWKNPEVISIKIPENVESESYWVTIKVYNMLSLDRGEFLGQVSFSFWSLFCLHYGVFTLQLGPEISNVDQFIKAKITLAVDIYSPLWDSVKCFSTPGIERTISVLGAQGLPKVNNTVPSTKCVVFYDGGIKVRSSLVTSSVKPVWSPIPTLDILLDYRVPKDIIIQIIYVDVIEKREFCLGEVAVPFEFIVRPPAEPFELWLTEPNKSAPKGYSFLLDGSLTLSITANKDSSTWKPWSSRQSRPLVHYAVEEQKTSTIVEKSSTVTSSALSPEELQWIGSAGFFTSPHILPARPDILLIPVRGMGAMVDGRYIGNDPQKQYALAVMRSPDKLTLSDPMMIQDSFTAIQKCMIFLRRKELYSHVREVSLNKLRLFFDSMLRKNRFDMSAIFKRVSSVISTCFPGVVSFITLLSKDSKSLRYTLFEKCFENEEGASFFTLWEGQGVEWSSVGRHAGRSSTTSSEDLAGVDPKYTPTCFSRFRQFRSPRLCAPLTCGDVSLGVVGMENFDVYRAGSTEELTDLNSIQQWLDNVGTLCGDILYTGRERNVMKLLELYSLLSTSSVSGLLKVLLENCLQVLQGCRLMEIWSLQDRALISLATAWPDSVAAPTKWIAIQGIEVHFAKAGGGAALKSEIKNVGKKIGKFLFGSKDKVEMDEVDETKQGEESVPSPLAESCGFVLGIYYGGFEQYQFVEYFSSAKDRVEDFEHTFQDVKIYIGNDRDIWLSLYCIDNRMSILEQWSGKFQMVNFREKKILSSLQNSHDGSGHFSFSSTLLWPSAASASMQRAVEMKALLEIQNFSVTLHQAHGLQKTDLVGSSDPFCEIYWHGELLGKTKVVKDNLEPVWEETFVMEPASNYKQDSIVSCRIEVWDMDFLGKGNFLGEFSIPLDQLLQPPTSDIEVTLGPRSTFNKTENKYVGGTLVLSQKVERKQVEDDNLENDSMSESSSDSSDSDDGGGKTPSIYELTKTERHLARKVVELDDAVLKLNVGKASGLAKADLLGLANAYVKVFRMSTAEFMAAKRSSDSASRDPLAVTRVIEKSLSPAWNDELVLGLDVRAPPDVQGQQGLLDEWPVFILEVWSKVRIGDGTFLGMLALNPLQYALKKSFSGDLSKSPFLDTKGNKYVQGSISVDFKIEGQAAESQSASFSFSDSKYLLPSTHATLTIVSAKVNGVIKSGLRKKSVNPYCVVRWNREKVGETAVKKNSVEPSWANEKMTVDLSRALVRGEWRDMTVEVWNKQPDESTCFGEIIVSMMELLHPHSGEVIQRNLTKVSAEGEKESGQTKGHLTFRLSKHYFPQRIYPKLKYVHCYPLELKSFDKAKADPILKHYGQENPRVILTNPVRLEVIRDTEEEIRRQRQENIDLPGVISHIEELNRKYTSSVFDQVGLISEMHYGQTLSAYQRQAATVLHIGDCDCFLLPTIVKRAGDSRGEEGKKGAAEVSKGKLAETKQKKKKADFTEGDLCLVSRYMKDSVPQRDVKFLKNMRDIISTSIVLFERRQLRRIGRQGIIQKLKDVCADIHRYSPEDVILSTTSDASTQFDCKVEIFLLRRSQNQFSFVRCSSETGAMEESEEGNELVEQCGRLCRHGLLLQFYRGRHSVASAEWKEGFSEASLLPLHDLREDVRATESKALLPRIAALAQRSAPMGACLSPIMLRGECLVGVMLLSGTDRIPHSIYRVLSGGRSDGEESTDEDIETHQLFEEGTTESMRDVGLHLGKALFKASVVHSLREVKTFPVRDDTDPEDVIRFCFRKLAQAVPVLSQISIWRVLVTPKEDVSCTVPEEDRDCLLAAGFFRSEQVGHLLATPDERVAYQAYHGALLKEAEASKNAGGDKLSTPLKAASEFSSTKKLYAESSPWAVGSPAMLTREKEAEAPGITVPAVEPGGEESSEDNDSDSGSGSDSDSGGSGEAAGKGPSTPPASLAVGKSLFGGLFGRKQAPVVGPAQSDRQPLPDDSIDAADKVIRAHCEINRCINTLKQSSFPINVGGGAYLSIIPNKPGSSVVDEVIKKKFAKSRNFFNEKNVIKAVEPRSQSPLKKKLIPSMRGVNTAERLIHVSESDTSPPNLKKAPLPKGNKASIRKPPVHKGPIQEDRSASVEERYEYFVAVRARGVGGDDGWGTVGEEVAVAVDSMVESMLDILGKCITLSLKPAKSRTGSHKNKS